MSRAPGDLPSLQSLEVEVVKGGLLWPVAELEG